jgi:hypothetical protein
LFINYLIVYIFFSVSVISAPTPKATSAPASSASASTSTLAAPTSDLTPRPVSTDTSDRFTKNYVEDYVDSDDEEVMDTLRRLKQKYKGDVVEQSKGK